MEGISILLAEKQPLIAAGLKYYISVHEEFTLSGEVSSRQELFQSLKKETPYLLIISYDDLPGFELEDFGLLRNVSPATEILAISTDLKKERIMSVMKAGVLGILTKDCSQNEILNAMRATAQGEKFFCGKILDMIVEGDTHKEDYPSIAAPLTSRELEIVRHIMDGQSTKEIADLLNLSTHTINAYRKSLLKKLDVRSPAELAIKAIKMGIIEI